MPSQHATTTASVRMTKPELARIDNTAARIGVSRNKLIMDAIARELDRLEATEATEEARD